MQMQKLPRKILWKLFIADESEYQWEINLLFLSLKESAKQKAKGKR